MDKGKENRKPEEKTSVPDAAAKTAKKFRVTESWGYVLFMGFILLLAGQTLGEYIVKPVQGSSTSDAMTTCMFYFQFIGVWILVLLDMVIFKSNRFMLPCLWVKRPGNTGKMLLIGLAAGFAANMICILAAIEKKNIFVAYDSFKLLPLLAAFACVFIQSSSEELICRCWCYEKILRHHSPGFAILATALFFASIHLLNDGVSIISILNIALVGILYAMIVYYFDSIWITFGIHTAWNYTQNLLMGLPNSGNVTSFSVFKMDAAAVNNSWAYDAGFGVEGSVTCLVIHLAAIVLLWYFCRNRKPGLFVRPAQNQ